MYMFVIWIRGTISFTKKLKSELEPDITGALRVIYKDDNYVHA